MPPFLGVCVRWDLCEPKSYELVCVHAYQSMRFCMWQCVCVRIISFNTHEQKSNRNPISQIYMCVDSIYFSFSQIVARARERTKERQRVLSRGEMDTTRGSEKLSPHEFITNVCACLYGCGC